MLEILQGQTIDPVSVTLPHELTIRGSTGPVRGEVTVRHAEGRWTAVLPEACLRAAIWQGVRVSVGESVRVVREQQRLSQNDLFRPTKP